MVDDGINTSNNNNNNNNPEGEDREINLYAVFFKYMVYWPWFVASVLACCIGMYVFLRYDLFYLEHRSWLFDFKILVKTFLNIAFGKKF